MVRIFTTLILLISASLVFGQISADLDTVFVSGDADAFEIVGKIKMTNESSTTKSFTWVRDESGFVDGWTSGFCDNNTCYFATVSTATFEIDPGVPGTMDLHLYPNGYCGEGFGLITVTDDSDPTNFAVFRYDFEAITPIDVECATATSVDDFKLDYVKVYPNPANDFFTLTDVPSDLEIISVYNILGNKVKSYRAVQNANYNVSDLPKGLYLINLTNSKGENLNTIKLHKS